MSGDKNRIMRKSLLLFTGQGPRRTTMDDIAREVSISKKTLYKYFDNKAMLIDNLYRQLLHHAEVKFRRTIDSGDNPLLELLHISRLFLELSRYFPRVVVRQLKTESDSVYKELLFFKRQFLPAIFSYNIERGKADGLYRRDVDANVAAHLLLNQLVSYNADLKILRLRYSGAAVQQQLICGLVYSIASTTGVNMAEKYLNPFSPFVQV